MANCLLIPADKHDQIIMMHFPLGNDGRWAWIENQIDAEDNSYDIVDSQLHHYWFVRSDDANYLDLPKNERATQLAELLEEGSTAAPYRGSIMVCAIDPDADEMIRLPDSLISLVQTYFGHIGQPVVRVVELGGINEEAEAG